MSVRVSIALCTYNGEAFLVEQLRSILAQSVLPDEVVVADDGSTDNSLEIVRTVFAEQRAVKLRVLPRDRPEPYGVANNFARALAATSCDIVLLSDQDDVWLPFRVERTISELSAHPQAALVHSDARLVDAAGVPLGINLFGALRVSEREKATIDAGQAFSVLLRRNLVTGATAAVRRELIDLALPIPAGWLHDEWLAVVAASLRQIRMIREALIDYRQHGRNQVGATKINGTTRMARLREPRAKRNARLLRRAESLVERLADFGADIAPENLALARGKLLHERFRSALPRARPRRIVPIVRQWGAGHYRKYGGDAQDVLRDFVQPS